MANSYFPSDKEIEEMLSGDGRSISFKTSVKSSSPSIDKVIEGLSKKPYITVGIHESAGSYPPEEDGSPGASVAQIATWNEFGTERSPGTVHIPARSFMGAGVDENKEVHAAFLEKLVLMMFKGSMDLKQGFETFGLKIETSIRKKLDSITTPPNAALTIKRKGSSKPLIDTGQMRNSIRYVVKMNGGDSKNG